MIEGADTTGATSRTAVVTVGNKEWGYLADPNSSGKGSQGESRSGIGVSGVAVTGTGVYAQSSSGDALRCSGRASFLGPRSTP